MSICFFSVCLVLMCVFVSLDFIVFRCCFLVLFVSLLGVNVVVHAVICF